MKKQQQTTARQKAANKEMGMLMTKKVSKTVQMKEQTNKGAKRN